MNFERERADLSAAFRWTVRLNMHEAVANHFSLSVNNDGSKFLINPNQMHFSRIKASDLLLVNANDPNEMRRSNAPDPTAWGLHSALHRSCPHAKCAMHVHSTYATVLAVLADSSLPPVDQTSAMFFNRIVYDIDYKGLAFENEGERCAQLFSDPKKKVMVMGNHGILVIGESVSDTFDRLFFFERAAKTYILALQTGKELRRMSDEIAERVASEIENYPTESRHFDEIKAILDSEGSDYCA
ncbi:MAG: class II aldolase and adducin N-terminal domain-containing protein [Pseudomonadota bacterium]|nr:class II aldolase and adducin N-terminal domain-containing protein [Pseudomonadota bacterium]